jgi:putative membrane protein
LQFRRVLKTLKPVEVPEAYRVNSGVLMNLVVAGFGIVLIVYLLLGPVP